MRVTNPKADLFRRYRKLAFKVASNFAERFRRPYHEMVDEALFGMAMEICNRWDKFDPERASHSTWLYQACYWHLMNHCLYEVGLDSKRPPRASLDAALEVEAPPRYWAEALWQELGEEGRALLLIVLDCPGDLARVLTTRRVLERGAKDPAVIEDSRNKLIEFLITELGWDDATVERAWEQVETCLSA